MATFFRRDEWITDATGNALSGADVYVCSQPATTTTIPPSPLQQVYADPAGTQPLTQPVQTDGFGHAFYYVASGMYTVVYYSPLIGTTVLPDQDVATGNGGVTFPITVAEGGTNANNAPAARTNLSAAGSGANTDITSLTGISDVTINSTGFAFNDGTNPVTLLGSITGPNGFMWGSGTFSAPTSTGVLLAGDGPWSGLAASGAGFGVANSGGSTVMTSNGIQSSGTLQGNVVTALQSLSVRSTSAITIQANGVESFNTGTALTLVGQGVSGAGSVSVAIGGNSNAGQSLLGFINYPEATTAGAPTTTFLTISINGTLRKISLLAN